MDGGVESPSPMLRLDVPQAYKDFAKEVQRVLDSTILGNVTLSVDALNFGNCYQSVDDDA
jgi:hypothetical protein